MSIQNEERTENSTPVLDISFGHERNMSFCSLIAKRLLKK